MACADDAATPTAVDTPAADPAPPTSAANCDPDNGGLILPPGFCAVVVAKGLTLARHMAVRPNGDLYVALDNGGGGSIVGGIMALRDTDGDGRADVSARFGSTGGNGIDYANGQLFFAPNDRILRYDFVGDELVPVGGEVTVASDLTFAGDHRRKTVVHDGAGSLFVNFGSASNSCQVENRVDFSPGVDPCPELDVRAGVWRFSANATGQTQTLDKRFATELRNMNALAINPADGALYGVQLGRDQLWDNWPTLFTERDEATIPGETLFRIDQGKTYGWPYCYYDGVQNRTVLAPEYGGDGKIVGRCASRELPLADYPAHWSPLGMYFYTGTQFPQRYQGGIFIAWHGSRFGASTLNPAGTGYVVTFTPWKNGKPSAKFETFADGFAGGNPTPSGAAHRPVDVQQAPDGSLYISDDKGGWIWRVFYVGTSR
jgi:glucose/arabinose dehydrogenase